MDYTKTNTQGYAWEEGVRKTMVSKPRTFKRLIPAFGLALIASLALGALAAGSASALSLVPASGKYPYTVNVAGGPFQVQEKEQTPIYCNKSGAVGKFTNGTSAELTLYLSGCAIGAAWECNSVGQPAGTIATSLKATLVYLDAAKTKPGLMLAPQTWPFAEMSCGFGLIKRVWYGELGVSIYEPGLNVSTKVLRLQTLPTTQIDGVGLVHSLNASTNGGALVPVVRFDSFSTLTGSENAKLIP